MSTVARAKRMQPPPRSPRLLTAADLAALPEELPSGPVKFELDNGRLVVMPPPGYVHGATDSNLNAQLKIQGEFPGHGKVCTQVGVILWRDPDRVVGPDGQFIHKSRLPLRISQEGYLETIADLFVEVRSKNDSRMEIRQKVRDYLKAGARAVWVADPQKQTVTEYRPGKKPKVFKRGDTLTIDDIIPGFRVAVADVFAT